MKNYRVYIIVFVALIIGLLLGKFLFNNTIPSQDEHIDKQKVSASKVKIWTCSMHPQIRQNDPGDCPICGMDLIPADQSNHSKSNEFQMTEDAIQLANIQTSIVGRSNYADEGILKLNGKIQANETKFASLVTHIPGRIEELYVSYTGEHVSKGQKIASIYSPELITAQKELLEAQKIQDISPNLLKASINKLKYWKIEEGIIQEIINSGEIRNNFPIFAAHSGIVDQKRVSVGDYLTTGEVLFDIQNISKLWAIFDVYESDLANIEEGREISFTTPSIPNKSYTAHIDFVNPVINQKTRVASIRAEVDNSANKLKPEMFITGKLKISSNSKNITVPKSAVLWTGKRSVVYVKQPNSEIPSFEYREIVLGDVTESGYEVMKGLKEGEEVVTNGAFVIDASAQLNNQTSMMNKIVMKNKDSKSSPSPDFTLRTPTAFKEQLSTVLEAYLLLKDALVASNANEASQLAKDVSRKVKEVDMKLLKDKAHLYWMEQFKAIHFHANEIKGTEDINEQRKQFDFLSQALIKSLKAFGVVEKTIYVQHCPMANNNEGADWLSKNVKILNPYFGDKMLTCGKIQDTIN